MFEADWPRFRTSRAAPTGCSTRSAWAHRRDQFPTRLSVGERQRVAIARALANEPKALLADEPTGNLDSVNQDEVLKLLDRLRRERSLTLVVVTHSHEVAASCDRMVKMRDGRVVDP